MQEYGNQDETLSFNLKISEITVKSFCIVSYFQGLTSTVSITDVDHFYAISFTNQAVKLFIHFIILILLLVYEHKLVLALLPRSKRVLSSTPTSGLGLSAFV